MIRNLNLVERIRKGFRKRNLLVWTPKGNRSPILSFGMKDELSLGRVMRENGLYLSAKSWRGIQNCVRLSPHFCSPEGDIDWFFASWDRLSRSEPVPNRPVAGLMSAAFERGIIQIGKRWGCCRRRL